MAALQTSLKEQRKTVRLSVPRTMEARTASVKHDENRYILRHMYLAYGLLRGKTIAQVENYAKEHYNERYVDKLVAEYEESFRSDKSEA